MVHGRPREGSGFRVALGLIGLLAILGVAAAPFVSPVEEAPRGPGSHRGRTLLPGAMQGSMTLQEAADGASVSVADLIARLGLPAETPPDESIDQLATDHDLRLREVRHAVHEIQARPEP